MYCIVEVGTAKMDWPDVTRMPMPRLIGVFAGRTLTLLVLSCRATFVYEDRSWHLSAKESNNCPAWISGRGKMISWPISTKECCQTRGSNSRPSACQTGMRMRIPSSYWARPMHMNCEYLWKIKMVFLSFFLRNGHHMWHLLTKLAEKKKIIWWKGVIKINFSTSMNNCKCFSVNFVSWKWKTPCQIHVKFGSKALVQLAVIWQVQTFMKKLRFLISWYH